MSASDPTPWLRLRAALPRIVIPPALLVALHGVISLGFDGYRHFPPLDIPMHLAGGIIITRSGAALLRVAIEAGFVRRLDRLLAAFVLLCFATTAAVVWEFAEFIANRYLRLIVQGSLEDTLSDLLIGMLGAMPTALWCARRLPR